MGIQNHFPRFLILSHLNTLPSLPTHHIPSSITQSLTTLHTLNLSHTILLLSPSLPTQHILLTLTHTTLLTLNLSLTTLPHLSLSLIILNQPILLILSNTPSLSTSHSPIIH